MGKRKREREKQLLGTWPPTTVNVYIAELRKLSNDCDYGESLNEMLRDRLGLADHSNHSRSIILRTLANNPCILSVVAVVISNGTMVALRESLLISKT